MFEKTAPTSGAFINRETKTSLFNDAFNVLKIGVRRICDANNMTLLPLPDVWHLGQPFARSTSLCNAMQVSSRSYI